MLKAAEAAAEAVVEAVEGEGGEVVVGEGGEVSVEEVEEGGGEERMSGNGGAVGRAVVTEEMIGEPLRKVIEVLRRKIREIRGGTKKGLKARGTVASGTGKQAKTPKRPSMKVR